jgi:hypothetical protein
VRLASTTVQNVVTYTVIVDASNPDGSCSPDDGERDVRDRAQRAGGACASRDPRCGCSAAELLDVRAPRACRTVHAGGARAAASAGNRRRTPGGGRDGRRGGAGRRGTVYT